MISEIRLDEIRAVHDGKEAFVYDCVYDKAAGHIPFLYAIGSLQALRGITAALMSKNAQKVDLIVTDENLYDEKISLGVPKHAVGSMKRVEKKTGVPGVHQVVLYTRMFDVAYDNEHILRKKQSDVEFAAEMLDRERDEKRFYIRSLAGETDEEFLHRWLAFVARRSSEPLLESWAKPLWDLLIEEQAGIKALSCIRGEAWRCEITSTLLQQCISRLGKEGALSLE